LGARHDWLVDLCVQAALAWLITHYGKTAVTVPGAH